MFAPKFSHVKVSALMSATVLSFASLSAFAKPLVYVSVLPQKYLAEQIVGDSVDVKVLVQPGHNPHSYDPTGKQMAQLGKASLLFTTGVPFESTWLPRISKLNPDLVLVDTTKNIDLDKISVHPHEEHADHKDHGDDHDDHEGHDHSSHNEHSDHEDEHEEHHDDHKEEHGDHEEHDHSDHKEHSEHDDEHEGHHEDHKDEQGNHDGHDHANGLDPHVWMNPLMAIEQADAMTHALEKAFPESADQFEKGFDQLKHRLKALDHDIHEALEDYEGRTFMVFHPAWGHFAKQYHLEQIAIEFEGKSPSARKLVELSNRAKNEKIKVILVQNQFNKKPAERIASHIDARVVSADPLPYDLPKALEELTQQLLESWR